jgi:hypothetical protein
MRRERPSDFSKSGKMPFPQTMNAGSGSHHTGIGHSEGSRGANAKRPTLLCNQLTGDVFVIPSRAMLLGSESTRESLSALRGANRWQLKGIR